MDKIKNNKYESSLFKKDDDLKKILDDDDSLAFGAWLDVISKNFEIIYNENSGDPYDINKETRLFSAITDASIHLTLSGVDVALGMMSAIYELKAYKCFSVLFKYKNLNLLSDPIFSGDTLLEIGGPVFVLGNSSHVFNGHSFVSRLILDDESQDSLKWMVSDADLWKRYLLSSSKEAIDYGKSRLKSFFDMHAHSQTEFLATLGIAKIISLDLATKIFNESKDFFHPETMIKIENALLLDEYEAHAGYTPNKISSVL